MSFRLRSMWVVAHRWIGLTAGLLFVLLGLTGSALVFHQAIDEWLNPEILLTQEIGPRRPVQEIIAAAELAAPGDSPRAYFADFPRRANDVWTIWFRTGAKDDPKFLQVYVDPYTAEVTGQRVWGEYLTTWIYALHSRLLTGRSGEIIVGVSGLIMLLSIGTGVYLWWPLWKHSWRAAVAVRGGRRLHYDLHKVVGLASAALLAVLAFTGVYLIFPEWIRPLAHVVSAETTFPKEKLRSRTDVHATLDADQATDIARQAIPGGELIRLHLPSRPDDPYVARVRQPDEIRRSSGYSRIWIDRHTGTLLAVRDWKERTAADTFIAWQFPLHNGEAFGLVGRWVVFAAGLTPAVLYVTGFLLWWRRRRSRKRQMHRSAAVRTTAPNLASDLQVDNTATTLVSRSRLNQSPRPAVSIPGETT